MNMRLNAPGFFHFGQFGPSGQPNGFGRYWEPDMYPKFDILNEPPTLSEITALRTHRSGLATNTYDNFQILKTGGMCKVGNAYSMVLFRHTIELNNHDYYHYCMVRLPAYDSTPPGSGEYPILLNLHGNTNDPIGLDKITKWDDHLNNTDFYSEQCIVVFPLYFGYQFVLPGIGDYSLTCQNALNAIQSTSSYKPFEGGEYETLSVDDPQLKTDYLTKGLTADDIQIMAILQSLKAVLSETTALGISLNNKVGIIGGSLGAGMLYKVAPVLYDNGVPGDLEVSIALYGGTDQYAPFNVRAAKRLLASGVKERIVDEVYGSILDTKYTYGDIFLNQKKRIASKGVELYLSDPDTIDLKENLRYWFLEDSVARYWKYDDGPYPLQVYHGLLDDIVAFQNSRWFTEQMRIEGVKFDDEHFEYYESPKGRHGAGSLNSTSRNAMADLLSDVLGY